jgi:threonyl-tRNA synthetase
MIEHFAGLFPLWLAPRQAIVVPVSEKFEEYAKELNELLKQNDIRSEIDNS